MPATTPQAETDTVSQSADALDRRTFLTLMGAGLAAGIAGLGGCSKPQPLEKIMPYVRSPEEVIPGLPAYYASVLPTRGFASGFGQGVIVESHEGRPTKIEGNPLHPSSLGATDIFMQATVRQLYDHDRSKLPLYKQQNVGWDRLLETMRDFIAQRGGAADARVALLTNTLTSPTIAGQIKQLAAAFPKLRWFVDDPLSPGNSRAGHVSALGAAVTPVYDFSKAARIVSLDAHFFADEPGALRYARQFSALRRLPRDKPALPQADGMARLYVAEASYTFTGAVADHRLPVVPSMIPAIAAGILAKLSGQSAPGQLPAAAQRWVNAAADDLAAHRQRSVVLAGAYQPPAVHAAACAINALLGAPGNTLTYIEAVEEAPAIPGDATLAALTKALAGGEVDLLIMLDVNPAYTAPAASGFAETLDAFSRDDARFALHVGAYVDETAHLCTAHVPLSHPLESWSDLRGHDGTAAIVQPLIEPLWGTRGAAEILASLAALAQPPRTLPGDYELVRATWLDRWKNVSAEESTLRWRRSLRDGVVADTPSPPAQNLKTPDAAVIARQLADLAAPQNGTIELVFRPDPTVADGFYANNPWLQELAKPFSRETWGNVALVGTNTADRLGLSRIVDPSRRELPRVKVQAGGKEIELPAIVLPGHPENALTLHLGGGRRYPAESDQTGVGVDVSVLRAAENPWQRAIPMAQVRPTGDGERTAIIQAVEYENGRDIFRARPVTELPAVRALAATAPTTASAPGNKSPRLSLYQDYQYAGYKWGMVVDLSACIGCNACVMACQAENNTPPVGKEQVYRGREMHWLRIDTYFAPASEGHGDRDVHFMPMFCQHCENAPCELVCPVEATSHSEEGINEMTYNRCIGTRYCSNNCPYKVRRFNFLNFSAFASQDDPANLQAMQKNPNVTVRSRGVMEKCTYCIQRINRARIEGKRDWAKNAANPGIDPAPVMREPVESPAIIGGRATELPRLSVITACQQACPTEAFIFGDLNDAAALAGKLKYSAPWSGINYGVLVELNTQPRTSYLERITNPNPALAEAGGAA